jgi:hypothetical protein
MEFDYGLGGAFDVTIHDQPGEIANHPIWITLYLQSISRIFSSQFWVYGLQKFQRLLRLPFRNWEYTTLLVQLRGIVVVHGGTRLSCRMPASSQQTIHLFRL